MENLLLGFQTVLHFKQLFWILVGTVSGLWIGALPGVGPTMTMAVIIPFTYQMDPLSALLLLASIHAASNCGGAFTSILLNVPGEASSAATAFDGFPMAQQGKARVALGISVGASFFGSIAGIVVLMTLANPILKVALKFSPAEYFAMAMLGLSVVAAASRGSTLKGLVMGCIGLSISFVGVGAVLGIPRFTFGSLYLQAGIGFVPVMIGLFAISELIMMINRGGTIATSGKLEGSLWQGIYLTFKYRTTLLVSTIVGIMIGVIPGVGATAANFLAYSAAQKTSKHSEDFGKGAPEGIIAPEASNNSCVAAALIPALTLGIPGSAGTAILMVAITMHGLRPGPMLFTSSPELVHGFFAGLLLGAVLFSICALVMTRWFALVTIIKTEIVAPLLMVVSLTGAYANQRSITDVFIAIFFGIFGYYTRRQGYPVIGLVIGLVLGQLAEESFHQALMISGGDYSIFFLRPISGITLLTCLALFLGPEISKRLKKKSTLGSA